MTIEEVSDLIIEKISNYEATNNIMKRIGKSSEFGEGAVVALREVLHELNELEEGDGDD